ncbi:MAG: type II secretion system protein GspD [Pirellulales bacterium]
MVRTGLGIVLVVAFAWQAFAADTAEKAKAPSASAVAVSELLARMSKTPLGRGEAGLLRAVADLIEKEDAARAQGSATANSTRVIAAKPGAAIAEAAERMPAPNAAPAEQRTRMAIRLKHAPVIDVAKALEGLLDGERKTQRASEDARDQDRAVLVPEPVSNTLFVSGTPRTIDSVTELIAGLDKQPDAVVVSVCIAELLSPARDAKSGGNSPDDAAMGKVPSMESDGAAWLEWAKQHGRIEVLSRPQIMTMDNQPAVIKIGSTVPLNVPKPSAANPAEGNSTEQAEVGLKLELTPRVLSEGVVLVALDIQRANLVQRDGAAGAIIQKRGVQTTIVAKDGQTTVVAGLMENAADGRRQMIIAVTPRVNPKK